MPARVCLLLLAICLIACNPRRDAAPPADCAECACASSMRDDDTTGATTYRSVRGALLGSRFTSLEELKTVIRIEYDNGRSTSAEPAPDNRLVRVRHCSGGREVVSVLQTGASQGDIIKARYGAALGDRFRLLFRCPYAVINRKDLEKIYLLSRWRNEEGDIAFFDIAKLSAGKINTPETAFRQARDSTEKGYLNSFNHMTAQAFITSCFSEDLADFIADAHERYKHPELITGIFTGEQINDLAEGPVDNYVDLINNEWGQELGKQLKKKYGISRATIWTPALLADYLNDLQSYYSWAFQIGFEPYRPEDEAVRRFSKKINEVMAGR